MKRVTGILAFALGFLFLTTAAQGQTTRMGSSWIGKNYSAADYGSYQQPFLRKADTYWQSQDWENALIALDHAVAQNPSSVEARLLRAQLCRLLGMETQAAQDLRVANQINPHAANLFGYHGPFGLMELLAPTTIDPPTYSFSNQRIAAYFSWLETKAKEIDPNLEKIYLVENVLYALEDEEIGKAKQHLSELENLYPEEAITTDLKGFMHYLMGEFPMAQKNWDQSQLLGPEYYPINWTNLSYWKLEEGLFSAFLHELDQHLIQTPNDAGLHYLRGNTHLILGHREQALEDYSIALHLDSDLAEAYFNRGLAHLLFLDPTSACFDLEQAGELGYQRAYEKIKFFCVE